MTFVSSGQTDSLAQSDTLQQVRKFTYTSQLLMGAMIGDKDGTNHLSLSTFQGLRFKRMSAGLYLSYDNYNRWRVLSPGIGATYDFISKGNHALYAQVNGAYSKLWYQRSDEDNTNRAPDHGYQAEALLGYRLKVEKVRVYVSAGFRRQQIRYNETPRWWMWSSMLPTPLEVTRTIDGVVVQFGLGF